MNQKFRFGVDPSKSLEQRALPLILLSQLVACNVPNPQDATSNQNYGSFPNPVVSIPTPIRGVASGPTVVSPQGGHTLTLGQGSNAPPTPTQAPGVAARTPVPGPKAPAPQIPNATPTPLVQIPAGFVFSPYWQVGSGSGLSMWPSGLSAMTWAFAINECGSETWEAGGYSPAAFIPELVNAGKKYIISTGGWGAVFTCGSDSGFSTFIDRYYSSSLIGIDFDIEWGQTATVINNLVQRVKVAQSNPKYANLRFSFTVGAVTSTGIDPGGYGGKVMDAIRQFGVTNYYINLMTMDMTKDQNTDLGQWTIQSAQALHNKYGVPYSQIEVTPMAGPDDNHVNFSLSHASAVSQFATQSGLGGVHFWEFQIDKDDFGFKYTNAFIKGF